MYILIYVLFVAGLDKVFQKNIIEIEKPFPKTKMFRKKSQKTNILYISSCLKKGRGVIVAISFGKMIY